MADLTKPSAPAPLAQRDPELAQTTAQNAKRALADSTRKAYETDWARFAAHCARAGRQPLPALEEDILSHLNDLAREGLKLGTIRRAYGTIRAMHAHAEIPLPTLKKVQNTFDNLAKQIGARPRKAAPLTVRDLRTALLDARFFSGSAAGARDRAILLLGFAAALRRSEIVALDVADLTFVDAGVDVAVRKSKTDQKGEGAVVAVNYGAGSLCPVKAVQAWLASVGLQPGPLFRPIDRWGTVSAKRLHDQHVDRLCKAVAKAVGKDPTRYSGHSLRAGLATSAADAGRGLDEIMSTTRHASEKIALGYIRHADRFRKSANRGLMEE